jgi:GT2 family glycosyltransferase
MPDAPASRAVTGSPPLVSVVVPTRDRPDRLRACLAALEAQSAASFEVVVVDDGSQRAAAVRDVVATAPHARLVRSPGRGPAAARNLGAAAAKAPVVCFTDDDCRPEPGWVDALTARLGDATPAAAGPTLTDEHGSVYSMASQVITSHLTDGSRDGDRLGFAPTSNLACRSDVLRAVPFDERFPLAAGEDRDWCLRLAAGGGRLVFEPAARVWHHQDLTAKRFWRQQTRYGRGAYRFHRRHAGRRQPVRFYTDLIGAGFRHGWRVGALVVVAQVATAVGIAAEALADRRARDGAGRQ